MLGSGGRGCSPRSGSQRKPGGALRPTRSRMLVLSAPAALCPDPPPRVSVVRDNKQDMVSGVQRDAPLRAPVPVPCSEGTTDTGARV